MEQLEGPRLRVLLVDDNVVNQRVVALLLGSRDHEVVVANDGAEAVAAVGDAAFDVVLMDVRMPRLDGFEATAAIRAMEGGNRRLPIIAVTAHAMRGDRERCLEAGMDDYVSRPVRREELFRAIQRVLHHAPTDAFDRPAALARLGGDESFLAEVAGLFLEESPRLIDEVRRGVADGDAEALHRAAHGLRGSVSYFAARAASAAAARLEQIAAAGDLRDAAEALRELEGEVGRLADALRRERPATCHP